MKFMLGDILMQAYHRDVLEHMSPTAVATHPPPPLTNQSSTRASPEADPDRDKDRDRVARSPPRKVPAKRGREKRSGSRRHRTKTVIVGRGTNSF